MEKSQPAISRDKSLNLGDLKYTILFVDDEQDVLKSMVRVFRKENYKILTAESGLRAWQILKEETINVIVTDHRMPKITGVELLKKVKIVYPDTIRIMLTGYADIDAVMEAVNQGAVYKFITKPWNEEDLKLNIRLALVQYNLLSENKRLKDEQKEQMKNIDKLSKFINKSQLADLLYKKKLIGKKDLLKAKITQTQTGETMPEILNTMGIVDQKNIVNFIEKNYGFQIINLKETKISQELQPILPKEICQSNVLIPVEKKGNTLTVAMADPTDLMKIDAVKFMTGLKIKVMVGLQNDILYKIEEAYEVQDTCLSPTEELSFIEASDSLIVTIDDDESPDLTDLFSSRETPSAIQVVNAIIIDALNQDASDVHIEVKSQFVMVRYRISGLLMDSMHIPLSMSPAIISRIKVMAGLDIAEKRRPQDGRITVQAAGRMVDMRLSTLPTIAGEKIVFRILDRNSSIKDIDELGFSDDQIDLVSQLIKKPQGCILVTGPTGSGKTSTLYSLIHKTATIHKNYTTIEDPVEYYMEKAEQVMIKEKIGLTFPLVLRTLLRQDPDTIMLGEIRDFETAEVAFHAALTGHTVLSTLHTNSCVATITRLLDMGIKSHIISSALNGIIAQRLVRRICPNCMVDDTPSKETLGLLGLDENQVLKAKKGRGCAQCGNSGYQGRTGIYEVFNINNEIEMLLQQSVTEAEIKKVAAANGMKLLIHSGLAKIAMGVTTCEEILRVLGPQNLFQFKCPGCGKMLAERYHFCPHCAHALVILCRGCQRTLEADWNACPDCGTRVAKA